MVFTDTGLGIRSLVTPEGTIRVSLEPEVSRAPAHGEIQVRIDAAPLNPSDILLLLGPTDPSSFKREHGAAQAVVAQIATDRLAMIAGRIGRSLAVGNEGAGTIVAAGDDLHHLVGRVASFRSLDGTYAQYRTFKADDCLILPERTDPRDAAGAFINPLTALGMVETMRREGHSGLVHTAAASNLGQMLNRLCLKDGVPLVNVVRSEEQRQLLLDQGAVHVLDSSAEGFDAALINAIEQTGATLGFDAIGGGTMASRILNAMETVLARRLTTYSRYGSPIHKQIYIYGVLDPGPRVIEGAPGMSWGVGGWLMTWFYERIGAEDAARLRDRAAAELSTTFASRYSNEIGLEEMLDPDTIRAFSRRATGQKYLILPNGTPQ